MRKTDNTGMEKRASILRRVCAAIAVNGVQRLEGGFACILCYRYRRVFRRRSEGFVSASQQFLFVPKIVTCDQFPFIFETKTLETPGQRDWGQRNFEVENGVAGNDKLVGYLHRTSSAPESDCINERFELLPIRETDTPLFCTVQ